MKKMKQLSLGGLALTFILSSCSMDKRVYTSGYNIQWKNGKNKSDKLELVKTDPGNKVVSESKIIVEPTIKIETAETSFDDISNNITASTDNSIFVPSTPKFDFSKNQVKTVTIKNTPSEIKIIVKKQKKQNKKATTQNAGGDDSKLLLFILCFFLGALGIHRFYLGYTGMGILYLLTGGLKRKN